MVNSSIIIKHINDVLLDKLFIKEKFAGSKLFGIAETDYKKEDVLGTDKTVFVSVPCSVDDNGYSLPIYPDDNFPVILFHKFSTGAYKTDAKLQHGRNNIIRYRLVNVSLIVLAMREKIKMNYADLEFLISSAMPLTISKDQLTKLALKNCSINVLASDFNSHDIYRREWPDAETPLAPGNMVFEINYQIGYTFDKDCINSCNS